MKITRKSQISGAMNTMELDITEAQVIEFESGVFVQDAFPNLNAGEREFILTGITPEEWAKVFPPEEEDKEVASKEG